MTFARTVLLSHETNLAGWCESLSIESMAQYLPVTGSMSVCLRYTCTFLHLKEALWLSGRAVVSYLGGPGFETKSMR